jgi:hypothetical protein
MRLSNFYLLSVAPTDFNIGMKMEFILPSTNLWGDASFTTEMTIGECSEKLNIAQDTLDTIMSISNLKVGLPVEGVITSWELQF